MLCYFVIYNSNITFKLTIQVLFCIIIISLITVLFFDKILAYGNISLFPRYCLSIDPPINIDQYVQYIKNLLASDINQEIDNRNLNQGFCMVHSELESQPLTSLPSSIYYFQDILPPLISLQIVPEIIAHIFKPSILIELFTIIITGLTMKSLRWFEGNRPKERKGFTQLIKHNVLKRQDNKCGHCRKILTVVDFHHKNGDRSDNKQSNCLALCPNCHAIETRGILKRR